MSWISLLKKVPIDFGQESVAETTKGKAIAMSLVPEVPSGGERRALDVGCRKGVQSRWLESMGYRVTSIDVEKHYEKCEVLDMNEGTGYADGTFDLIWCSEVIEHLRDPARAIAEFQRIAKDGADIILTTPNSYFWLFRLFSLFGVPPSRLQRSDHLSFFRLSDLEVLCPEGTFYGFFPYLLLKFRIRNRLLVGILSPTLVVHLRNGKRPGPRRG